MKEFDYITEKAIGNRKEWNDKIKEIDSSGKPHLQGCNVVLYSPEVKNIIFGMGDMGYVSMSTQFLLGVADLIREIDSKNE